MRWLRLEAALSIILEAFSSMKERLVNGSRASPRERPAVLACCPLSKPHVETSMTKNTFKALIAATALCGLAAK